MKKNEYTRSATIEDLPFLGGRETVQPAEDSREAGPGQLGDAGAQLEEVGQHRRHGREKVSCQLGRYGRHQV